MEDKGKTDYKVSYNGQELQGQQAQEFAQKLAGNLMGTFGNLFSDLIKNIPGTDNANISKVTDQLGNLGNIFSGKDGENPINLSKADFEKFLPVFEKSDDNKRFKMSMNDNTLFDFDIDQFKNMANQGKKSE